MSDHCRSCGVEVIWTVTETGKQMPVDVEPVENGNLLLMHRKGFKPLSVYQSKEMLAALAEHGGLQAHRLHLSHFATCPQSKKWRKKQ